MTEKEIPVRNTLSSFYLGAELDDVNLNQSTAVLAKSGFTLGELKQINLREPFLLPRLNLLSVTGGMVRI